MYIQYIPLHQLKLSFNAEIQIIVLHSALFETVPKHLVTGTSTNASQEFV